jgi:hypothetical protein
LSRQLVRKDEGYDKTRGLMRGGNIRYFKDLLEYDPAKELEREDGVSYT